MDTRIYLTIVIVVFLSIQPAIAFWPFSDPILVAVKDNDLQKVNKLLKKDTDIDINYKYDESKYRWGRVVTLLHIAAIKSSPDIINVLINNGAVINIKSYHGYTPLHFAAAHGRWTHFNGQPELRVKL